MDSWHSGAWSDRATGDKGPWVRWLPLAWAAAADPDGRHTPPPDPHKAKRSDQLIAWWAPLLQLTTYGLGWAFPMRGLARWDQLGRPTDDAVLATVQRWWGPRLADILAWGQEFTPGLKDAPDLANVSGQPKTPPRGSLFHPYSGRLHDREWQEVWEQPGSGKFHSWLHAAPPLWPPQDQSPMPTMRGRDSAGAPAEALVLDGYLGWYRRLLISGPGNPTGASRRVDVIVRPLGWLGTYRCSRITNLWFRCRHHLHLLGNEPYQNQG
ncbi:hypothetical protein JOF54_003824 [Microlunatus capsulatus]|uniref:Uncharacterized protein n=1 Tax=Microlunatus capsulatus TaxID=99117 RepID=A0ABS4ZDV3_9ACTN|nr:hypothetical protein [Microlunatus capsulatus]